jgi:hypothetical protein
MLPLSAENQDVAQHLLSEVKDDLCTKISYLYLFSNGRKIRESTSWNVQKLAPFDQFRTILGSSHGLDQLKNQRPAGAYFQTAWQKITAN